MSLLLLGSVELPSQRTGRTPNARTLARKSRETRNPNGPEGIHAFRAFFSMLLPLFLNLAGRRVVLVGAGPVAAAKLQQLLAARAAVCVVAPQVTAAIDEAVAGGAPGCTIVRREFAPADLDGAWLVVAAATPEVNRAVAQAAEERRL